MRRVRTFHACIVHVHFSCCAACGTAIILRLCHEKRINRKDAWRLGAVLHLEAAQLVRQPTFARAGDAAYQNHKRAGPPVPARGQKQLCRVHALSWRLCSSAVHRRAHRGSCATVAGCRMRRLLRSWLRIRRRMGLRCGERLLLRWCTRRVTVWRKVLVRALVVVSMRCVLSAWLRRQCASMTSAPASIWMLLRVLLLPRLRHVLHGLHRSAALWLAVLLHLHVVLRLPCLPASYVRRVVCVCARRRILGYVRAGMGACCRSLLHTPHCWLLVHRHVLHGRRMVLTSNLPVLVVLLLLHVLWQVRTGERLHVCCSLLLLWLLLLLRQVLLLVLWWVLRLQPWRRRLLPQQCWLRIRRLPVACWQCGRCRRRRVGQHRRWCCMP